MTAVEPSKSPAKGAGGGNTDRVGGQKIGCQRRCRGPGQIQNAEIECSRNKRGLSMQRDRHDPAIGEVLEYTRGNDLFGFDIDQDDVGPVGLADEEVLAIE